MLFSQVPTKSNAVRRSLSLLLILLCVLVTRVGWGQIADTFDNTTYYNNALVNIPCTNFINDYGGTFSMAPPLGAAFPVTGSQPFVYYGWLGYLYGNGGWDYVQNFSNYSEMDCYTGFRFDTRIPGGNNPGHFMASSFYNAGNIYCGTTNNATFFDTLYETTFTITSYLQLAELGGIYIMSSNIVNSGTITVGVDGLGQISGQNLDFTRGTLTMLSDLEIPGQSNTSAIFATGQTGFNTNAWYPDIELTLNTATASQPTVPLTLPTPQNNIFSLTNSTPYFSVDGDGTGTNFIVRMVFIQNDNPNVPYSVYFGSAGVVGTGFTTIGWTAPYISPVTGQPGTNYIYLNDDYVEGSSANILAYLGGIPFNYGIAESATPLFLGAPAVSSFPPLFGPDQPFPPGFAVTNIYSYVDAQLAASDFSTNDVSNGALTNLPGRFEITATNELNLSLSSISGMNYLLLDSPKNFDDDGQSTISSPFTDVYLGRTNNTLTATNLLVPSLPFCSGTIEGWSTRWIYSDTNAGVNYDYRVLIVESALTATTPAYQQDFVLYSSNNVVISDTLNILRTLSLNCTNLLLTTNGVGNGADSLDGELNLDSANIYWATSTPRLRCVTNNGAIRTLNLTSYGSSALPYLAFVNNGIIANGSGASIISKDFENYSQFNAGSGSFSVQSLTTTMTNGSIIAAGAFTNISSSFVVSNTVIQAGRLFEIIATNLLTDGGTPGNFWSLGANNGGAGTAPGLIMPLKPVAGDLLGTTISNIATAGTSVNELWAGQDRGAVNAGFSNNAAIGQLIFDAQGSPPHTQFNFSGAGVSNAIYVDNLVLQDNAAILDLDNNVQSFAFNNNLVIYYAQAMINGQSVAEKLNGKNSGHLRWVSSYAGTFSSTYIVYPDGTTNAVNAALAQSSTLDSDRDGTVNSSDPTPVLVPSQVKFSVTVTNQPTQSVRLQWPTIPLAGNYVYYTTNLLAQNWQPFTNFNYFYWTSNNVVVAVTNAAHAGSFVSPQPYVNTIHPADNWETTNVWIYDAVTNAPHFYRVMVQPN